MGVVGGVSRAVAGVSNLDEGHAFGVSDCVVSWQPRLSRPSQQAFWPPSSSNGSLLVVQIPAMPLHGAWPAIKKWLISRVNTVQFDQLPSC